MKWLTREQLCAEAGFSQATMYRRIAKGEIAVWKTAAGKLYRRDNRDVREVRVQEGKETVPPLTDAVLIPEKNRTNLLEDTDDETSPEIPVVEHEEPVQKKTDLTLPAAIALAGVGTFAVVRYASGKGVVPSVDEAVQALADLIKPRPRKRRRRRPRSSVPASVPVASKVTAK